jgi:uncharacterized protein YqgV (UPF0045/DUF77 family)
MLIAELHCYPSPVGDDSGPYTHVDTAIGVVAASGLTYEVGPLGTTFEGPADQVWATLRAAHEATLASGAEANMTHVRLIERPGSDATMGSLTAPHRP